MPYSVNSCFEKFRREVVDLEPEQVKTARASRDFVLDNIARLSNEGELPDVLGYYCLNYGSFARNTKIRPLDDIDMMICYDGSCGVYDTIRKNELYHIRFADNHPFFDDLRNDDGRTLNSRKVMNQLIGALSGVEKYSKADLHRRGEAATLQLSSYPWNFDIVPCFYTKTGFYLIPDGQGHWKNTDPRIDRMRIETINQKNFCLVLPLVRLMKYWKALKWGDVVSSYMFEQMVLDGIESDPMPLGMSWQVRVERVLRHITNAVKAPVWDPKEIQGDLNDLDIETKNHLSEVANISWIAAYHAIKKEREGDIKDAIRLWRSVFGDMFPEYGA